MSQPVNIQTASTAEIQSRLDALRIAYEEASKSLGALTSGRSKAEDRRPAIDAWHQAALAFFNAHDHAVAHDSLCRADREPGWYTYRAETAANLLQTICHHFTALRDRCEAEKISYEQFEPSPTAFAGVQRLAMKTHRAVAIPYRERFVQLSLPTHGFDTDESIKAESGPPPARGPLWERIVAAVAGGLTLALVAFVVIRNEPFADPNIVVFVRLLASLGVGLFGTFASGFLALKINNTKRGLAIRAGGGLALFVLTYAYTPQVLPLTSSHNKAETSPAPVERFVNPASGSSLTQ